MDVTPAAERRSRRSSDETKDAIRAVSFRLFAERGFTEASVRDIAREADVDAAVVIRLFGSKEHLFLETMGSENSVLAGHDGPVELLGASILRRILLGAPRARQVYTALVRAADRPGVRSYLVRTNEAQFVGPIAARLSGSTAHFRASLIAAQVNGLLHSLWILEDPALVETPVETLIEVYGEALQALADEPAHVSESVRSREGLRAGVDLSG